MKIEGDGRQYWLVLNPDPHQEKVDRVLDKVMRVWYNNPQISLVRLLENAGGNDDLRLELWLDDQLEETE